MMLHTAWAVRARTAGARWPAEARAALSSIGRGGRGGGGARRDDRGNVAGAASRVVVMSDGSGVSVASGRGGSSRGRGWPRGGGGGGRGGGGRGGGGGVQNQRDGAVPLRDNGGGSRGKQDSEHMVRSKIFNAQFRHALQERTAAAASSGGDGGSGAGSSSSSLLSKLVTEQAQESKTDAERRYDAAQAEKLAEMSPDARRRKRVKTSLQRVKRALSKQFKPDVVIPATGITLKELSRLMQRPQADIVQSLRELGDENLCVAACCCVLLFLVAAAAGAAM